MFCPNCGQMLADGTKHCPVCGADLSQVNMELGAEAENAAQPADTAAFDAAGGSAPEIDFSGNRTNEFFYQNQYDASQQSAAEPELDTKKGFAITGLVLAIVGGIFVCCFFPLGLVLGIAGVIFSIIGLKSKKLRVMSIIALILNILVVLICALLIIFAISAANALVSGISSGVSGELPEEFWEAFKDVPGFEEWFNSLQQ